MRCKASHLEKNEKAQLTKKTKFIMLKFKNSKDCRLGGEQVIAVRGYCSMEASKGLESRVYKSIQNKAMAFPTEK